MTYLREAVISYQRSATKCPAQEISNSISVAEILRTGILPDEPQERVVGLAIDGRGRVRSFATLALGSENAAPISVSSVARWAILTGCRRVILAHRHPSGDPAPSSADDVITARLVQALAILEIQVLDHVILGEDCHYSYTDAGRLPGVA